MTHSAPVIRRAEPRDAAALAALFDDATTLPFAPVAPLAGIAAWEKKLGEYADTGCLPLIASSGDAVIGVLLLRGYSGYIRRKHCAAIDLLAVRVSEQRKGVGRALVNAALAACDGFLQVRRIEVNVGATGAPLKAFYASLGFVEEGVRRAAMFDGGYRDAALLARVNERVMPATAAVLPLAKRTRKLPPAKIAIRPATVDDAEAFARVFSDRSTSNGIRTPPPKFGARGSRQT
jgi:L-phenylalanine/L-methionine N-acetyltransferase